MKRVLSLILCMVSLLVLAVQAFAAERTEGNVVYRDEFTLEDGLTVTLSATLTKGGKTMPVTLNMTCDKDGNISYS